MAYLIGTDEAGYGPNFGPLVVSATVWQVPDGMSHADLYAAVKDCITAWPKHLSKPGKTKRAKKKAAKKVAKKAKKTKKKVKRKIRVDQRVWMADSKQLYKPGNASRGLAGLERGVLAALGACSDPSLLATPADWHDLWQTLCGDDHASMKQLPWYADFDECLPVAMAAEEVANAAERLSTGLMEAGVRLCRIRSRAIVLSHVTLTLAAEQIEWLRNVAEEPTMIHVLCDKHGGRNHYAALLAHHFPNTFVEVREESRPISSYAFGTAGEPVTFAFQAKADNILAAGLASMTSKYLRELAMRAFNDFWRGHDSELRPTAGYPGDARRFKQQIATVQADLGISDQVLWRER